MCLILFSYQTHPSYPLLFIGNRDEFYDRPTLKASFWKEAPFLLAGRDLKQGGTWFGVTKLGRIAAITNYRDPLLIKEKAPSRGILVSEYLLGREDPVEYLDKLRKIADRYNGFNLIVGDTKRLFWFSNRAEGIRLLDPGIYGLSNHLLNTPWPKTIRGRDRLSEILSHKKDILPEDLFGILEDRSIAEDESLPNTGVSLEWERILSSIFVSSPAYGTRSSTVFFIDLKGKATFIERTYTGGTGHFSAVTHEFFI